jgi:hypothetical protein
MGKFWVRFVGWSLMAVLFQASAAVVVHAAMSRWTLPESAIWIKQIEHTRAAPVVPSDHASLIILGDSRPFGGIRHSELARGARSLALPGATAVDVYYQLERYLERHAPPRLAIISIAPEHMVKMEQVFFDWSVRVGSVSRRQALEVLDLKKSRGGYRRPFLIDYWNERVLLELYQARIFVFYRSIIMQMTPRAVRQGRLEQNKLDNRFAYDYGNSRRRSSELNAEAKMSRFVPDPTLDAYLFKIFDLAERHGILVAYEVMPMNETSYKKLHPRYKQDFMEFLNSIAQKAPINTHVHAAIPHYPDELFSDPSHLNSRGAQRFTRVLQRRYAKILSVLADEKTGQNTLK